MPTDPRLPPELEREILELSAIFSRAQARFSHVVDLLLVAKRVKEWIEPILYGVIVASPFPARDTRYVLPPLSMYIPTEPLVVHTVHGDNEWDVPGPVPPIPTTIVVEGPASHRAAMAKHILLQITFEKAATQNAMVVFQKCTNIENLGLWSTYDWAYNSLRPYIARLPLRRLTLDIIRFIGIIPLDDFIDKHPAMFANLTHLHVHHLWDCSDSWIQRQEPNRSLWKALGKCPRITHLAIDVQTPEFVFSALDFMPQLELLVSLFVSPNQQPTVKDIGEESWLFRYDHRLVYLYASGSYVALFRDWERGVLGMEDFWVRAERIRDAGLSYEDQIYQAAEVIAKAQLSEE